MPTELRQRRVLSIFIGSPGDLQDERKVARNVVRRVNKTVGRHLDVHVELRGWEDTLPGYATRPQEKINEDLRECDIFLGLMWKRWGSPPSDDGEYTSGFEEEYHLALEQREAGHMREVFLYFKEMPDALREDAGPQASKVLEFRRSVEEERNVIYKTFEDIEEWKEVLFDLLAEYLTKHFGQLSEASEQGQSTRHGEAEREAGVTEASTSVGQILALLQGSEEEVSYLQIARASLYTSSLLYREVHTDHVLGTRELHYLYARRDQIELEPPESWVILRTLLADRESVKAGWYWIHLNVNEEGLSELLAHLATSDVIDEVRMQALRLLQGTSEESFRDSVRQIIEEEGVDRGMGAVRQLAEFANEADRDFLEQLATEEEGDLAQAAWRGVLVALSHEDANAAIDWIVEAPEQERSHFRDVLDPILDRADPGYIRKLLFIENETVRFKAMEAVKEDLEDDELRDLTQDGNLDIAAAAFIELIQRGLEVDEAAINERLDTKQEESGTQSTTSLGSLLTSYPTQPKTYSREDVLFEFYKTRDKAELQEEVGWRSIDGPIRYAALIDQHYDEFEDVLKEDLATGFERIREREIQQLRQRFGAMADSLIEKIEESDGFMRGSFYRAAFKVLSRHATPDDLEAARTFIDDPHQSLYTDKTLEYAIKIVEQFGSEEDVGRIKDVQASSKLSLVYKAASLLLELDPEHREEHALELLEQDDWKLKKLIFRYSLDEEEVLPIDSIRDLLYESHKQTRLGALAYLVQRCTKDELEALLQEYPSAEGFDFYYYDVICWLDRLVHAPEPISDWYRNELTGRLEEYEDQLIK